MVKYAILDTDFVFKANIIKTDDRVLADEVLAFPGYKFFCHHKMTEELDDHGSNKARDLLRKKIHTGEIICYDNQRIIEELTAKVGTKCFSYYQSFLKTGCNMMDSGFYAKYFTGLDQWLDSMGTDVSEFLSLLQSCEALIGHQKSYGEVKAFVLLRTICFLFDTEALIFCSDDRGARQGFANTALIPCISILSVFLKLCLLGKSYDETRLYYQAFMDWCLNRTEPQATISENNISSIADVYTLPKDSFKNIQQALMEAELNATPDYEKEGSPARIIPFNANSFFPHKDSYRWLCP